MPLISKVPEIVTREYKLEDYVAAAVENYAKMIDSTPDHVVNIVIKKNLWRDQDYRKWREQQRTKNQGSATTAGPQKG